MDEDRAEVTAVIAETGRQLTFEVRKGDSLSGTFALHTAIAVHDQIILSQDGNAVNESYPPPTLCFVFSKQILPGERFRAKPDSATGKIVTDSGVLWVQSENGFQNVKFGDAYLGRILPQILQRAQLQYQSIQIANRNLQMQLANFNDKADSLAVEFQKFNGYFSEVAASFEEWIRRLSLIELHPSLSKFRGSQTLLDRLSEGGMRSAFARSQSDRVKVSELMKNLLADRECIQTDCKKEMAFISDMKGNLECDNVPHSFINNLYLQLSSRESEVEVDSDIEKTETASVSLSYVEKSQADMLFFVQTRLASISDIQTRIRLQMRRLSAYGEVVRSKTADVLELHRIERIPEAYFAGLTEVVCRRRYDSWVADRTQQLEDVRTGEVQRRSVFWQRYGKYLPEEIIKGLDQQPSKSKYSMEQAHDNLSAIDVLFDDAFSPRSVQNDNLASGVLGTHNDVENLLLQYIRESERDKAELAENNESIHRQLFCAQNKTGEVIRQLEDRIDNARKTQP
uniref:Uncharacterized protein n=1 Tax=Spongospora subterranea TaxID=70186 RepID=A0A0H5R7Y6_9EUKA|eukprot:CRZ10243.1 hypothetical protein [Spongospora subterranea]